MIYTFLGFCLGSVIGAAITNYIKEKEIDEWRLLYHRCKCEMDRLYKQKDELWEKLRRRSDGVYTERT